MEKPCLAIAGASGFLGQNAIQALSTHYRIKALCRTCPKIDKNKYDIEWIPCDLFNLKSAENALKDCDYLLYLIHSMMNGTRLTQSSFSDLDLIIADNIGRASKKNGVKQVIYVGGIIPEKQEIISEHLKSREEVETVLMHYQIPLTSIRAGIIIGSGGSSFQIIYNLVKTLKLMIAPKWTLTKSQPVDLRDIIKLIQISIGNEEFFNQTIDAHGSELISYQQLLKKFAQIMKLNRTILISPYFSLGLSKLWLNLITKVDYHTISPLVESLKYNLQAKKIELFDKFIPNPIPLNQSIEFAINIESQKQLNKLNHKKCHEKIAIKKVKNVRSVQRLNLPNGWNAITLANEYIHWLEQFFFAIIKIKVDKNLIQFRFANFNLLVLTFSEDRSNPDRQLFYITDGFLVDKNNIANARFEFRICPHENTALAAIHDFKPALPWYLYRFFQAHIHAFVMYMFNQHLKRINKKS